MECVLRWLDDLDAGLLALRFAAVGRRARFFALLLPVAAGLSLLLL